MQKLNVLYFAHVRAAVGLSRETLEVPAALTVAAFRAFLLARHPGLEAVIDACRVAVDGEFAGLDALIPDGAEVVLIPPVSGGAGAAAAAHRGELPRVWIGPELLDATVTERLSARVGGPAHGAIVTFVGAVRDHARGQVVSELEYEAYVPMAMAQLERIADEVEAALPGVKVAVHHRVGLLVPGDVAVVVAVGSAHRKEAFAACQRVIDRLKEDVPIWKRETGPGGAVWIDDRP